MDTLLSLSFDKLSSRDPTRIGKGIRQIEGVLAQICLDGNQATASKLQRPTPTGQLEDVAVDPAFREFFRLQEGFQWNVATRLVDCLERVLGMPSTDQNNAIISSLLELLLGVLLLHPPSRTLFRRDNYMNILLDLLDIEIPAQIQSQALLVLVSALLATPTNTRTFEKQDGLLTVASLFKARGTSKEVKMKAVEFFYFYLMPEASEQGSIESGHKKPAGRQDGGDAAGCRSTNEKQQMLGRYLGNVAELVQDLRETTSVAAAA